MPTYEYKGRNQRGEAVNGRLEASSQDAVATQLFNTGVIPVDIFEANASKDVVGALKIQFGEQKVGFDALALLCRQMYTLLKAGVPILQALKGLRESTTNPTLGRALGDLSDTLDAGQDLTAGFKRHPKIFPKLFISLVQVGETTGSLDRAFLQLATYLEREKDTRDRIKSALRYPMMVLGAIVVAMFIINIFVIPAFAKVYAGFKVELPLVTKILLATSNFFVAYWPHMLIGLLATGLGFRAYIRTEAGRYKWDRFKLRIPVAGSIVYRATLGRFARAFAITTKAGVPIIQGMTVISRAVDNAFVSSRILQMRDGIERGETIARTAQATEMFPSLVVQMIAVGEDTGSIDDLMVDVAEYYEREVEHALKNISGSIEPILITVIGVMVLILALGVFLPMWDLAAAARG